MLRCVAFEGLAQGGRQGLTFRQKTSVELSRSNGRNPVWPGDLDEVEVTSLPAKLFTGRPACADARLNAAGRRDVAPVRAFRIVHDPRDAVGGVKRPLKRLRAPLFKVGSDKEDGRTVGHGVLLP